MSTQEHTYGKKALSINSLDTLFSSFYDKFKSCSFFYARFHCIFFAFFFLQLLSFLLFFSYLTKSAASAFAIALFVLTVFSYFVLSFFFQTKKPDQLLSLKDDFSDACHKMFKPENNSRNYLKLAEIAANSVETLNLQEARFYHAPSFFQPINPLLTKLRIHLHAKNFHLMKELLLLLSIQELVSFIKIMPSDLEGHAALSNSYMALSQLYVDLDPAKFLSCSNRALEELRILEEYGVEDPWLYKKLAEVYRLQGKPTEEIIQYEKLLTLSPNDPNLRLSLGILYFQEGFNAKGLKMYETLQEAHPQEAIALIHHYDAYPFHELSALFLT